MDFNRTFDLAFVVTLEITTTGTDAETRAMASCFSNAIKHALSDDAAQLSIAERIAKTIDRSFCFNVTTSLVHWQTAENKPSAQTSTTTTHAGKPNN